MSRRLLYTILTLVMVIMPLKAVKVRTLTGEFRQVREQAMFDEPQESRGHFSFMADSLLRWEYTTPQKFGLIAKNNKVSILREDGSEQSTSAYALESLVKMIRQSIAGNWQEAAEQFNVEREETKDGVVITLTPVKRANKQAFSKMKIWLDKAEVLAKMVKMWEKNGDTTTIYFQNLQLNK